MDITGLRLRSQRISRPEGATPAEVVRWFGAVQAQDLPGSLWAVGRRMSGAVTEAEFERAGVDGVEYWLSPGLIGGRKARGAYLLPPYDEYTVAYADRSAVVDRERLAATGHGIGPNVIIDGRLAARWKRTTKKDTVAVELDPLRPLTDAEKDMVRKEVAAYARFLGLRPGEARP